MPPKSQSTAGRATEPTNPQEALAAAQAEIGELRAQLAAREITPSRDQSPDTLRLATVLEALSQRLTGTPDAVERTQRSAKIADPPLLTDGADPTFENWKLQLQDKLEVNADHFENPKAKMAYVFSRTGGDAQTHLRPRYAEDAANPFASEIEMVNYLASIYEDPFKVQNARLDYKSLMMRRTEAFTNFHTRFLHLAGQARIPQEDLLPDLFDKLTLELQRAVLPVYTTVKTLQELTNHCLSLDQGLRRIKARTDRLKARSPKNPGADTGGEVRSPSVPMQATGPRSPIVKVEGRTGSPAAYPPPIRPTYSDSRKQALSDQGACFTCGQQGHISRDCPSRANAKEAEVVLVQKADGGSGKEEP